MAAIDKDILIKQISPPLDKDLTVQLLDEFISLDKRYVLRDWGPATLDGGQFAEAASRLIYHRDSGNLNRRKAVNKCLEYIEDYKGQNNHNFPERKSALHLCKVIRTIYKFRSDRGAVHIDPDYTANHVDSKLVLENTRWVLSEMLRIFWTGDRAKVANTIRYLVEYDIPAIASFDGDLFLQRTDCSTEEEILILLHQCGEEGLSRKELGAFVQKDSSGVTKALKSMTSNKCREVILLKNKQYRLTDLGIRRVLLELSEKLVVK